MSVLLRVFLGTVVVLSLAGCGGLSNQTSLANSVRVGSLPHDAAAQKKSLSSDVLSAIALERVTGRRPSSIGLAGRR